MFEKAELKARPGYNEGTGALTFTVPLPSSNDVEILSPLQAVVWAMLGVLPLQHAVENLFGSRQENGAKLLANECLRAFAMQTGVAITDKKVPCCSPLPPSVLAPFFS